MSLKNIGRLKPAEYSYKNPSNGETERLSMGIMAQDINEVWPYEKYSILQKDPQGFYAVEYYQLIAPMVKAIQELSDKVDKLQKELDK
jgi:trimeric autotransporter adhesin|tara:strand:+ start:6715 stop:6978 length:264 start_codon:yes stop_codon:yes gene_type:complete